MKKIISLLLLIAMLISPLSFASAAKVEGWTCLGAKWSSRTGMIIEDSEDNKIRDHGFAFRFTEEGSLLAEVPDYETMPGSYGTAVMSGHTREALDGLNVVIKPESFDFTLDENGIGNQISLLWTELPIDKIADPETDEGAAIRDSVYNKGLRNIMPLGGKGLCITLGNTNKNNNEEGTLIASDLSIVYYDGEATDSNGNLGKEWRFTRISNDGNDNIMPLILDPDSDIYPGYTGEYVTIDISYGLIIKVRADEELGYVINVNGKDYACEDDAIDLKALESVGKGYITAGVVSNAEYNKEDTVSIKLSYINLMTAEAWSSGENRPVVPCLHDYAKTVITEAECEKEGRCAYECILCGDNYSETIPSLGHSFTDYKIISEASCTEEGLKEAVCDNGCGERDTELIPATTHIPGEWEIIKEATEEEEGERIKKCTVCSEVLEREVLAVIPDPWPDPDFVFSDVSKNEWYYESFFYCFKKGYIVGDGKGYFRPELNLTREQFVLLLARVAGADISKYTASPFSDVNANSWYGPAVIWAYENGYIKGIGNGKFGVGEYLTRESIAVLMYRYAQVDEGRVEILDIFVDGGRVSDWARKAMSWAVSERLLGSTSVNALILAPRMTVTRAQAAKIIMSYDMMNE